MGALAVQIGRFRRVGSAVAIRPASGSLGAGDISVRRAAEVEIVPATLAHARTVPLDRAWHRRVERAGLKPRRVVLDTISLSVFSRAALIAGRPVAVWGVSPPVPGVWPANPWLFGEPSRAILRTAWSDVAEALERYDEAIIFAFVDDERSVRMALHFGFRGSAADVQVSQRQLGAFDQATTANNAALQAYGYRTQWANFENQAHLEDAKAINGVISSAIGSATDITSAL